MITMNSEFFRYQQSYSTKYCPCIFALLKIEGYVQDCKARFFTDRHSDKNSTGEKFALDAKIGVGMTPTFGSRVYPVSGRSLRLLSAGPSRRRLRLILLEAAQSLYNVNAATDRRQRRRRRRRRSAIVV